MNRRYNVYRTIARKILGKRLRLSTLDVYLLRRMRVKQHIGIKDKFTIVQIARKHGIDIGTFME